MVLETVAHVGYVDIVRLFLESDAEPEVLVQTGWRRDCLYEISTTNLLSY